MNLSLKAIRKQLQEEEYEQCTIWNGDEVCTGRMMVKKVEPENDNTSVKITKRCSKCGNEKINHKGWFISRI